MTNEVTGTTIGFIGTTYAEFVASKVKDGARIKSQMTPAQAHLMHMAVGVAGEAGELLAAVAPYALQAIVLDRINVVEELGDLEFFMEGVRAELGLIRVSSVSDRHGPSEKPAFEADVRSEAMLFETVSLTIAATTLLDAVKKNVIYQKAPDLVEIGNSLGKLTVTMAAIRALLGISRDEVLTANRIKLDKRYKKAYSNEEAVARADKA